MINIQLISIGNRASKSVEDLTNDYINRIPKSSFQVSFQDIKLAQRGANIPYQKAVDDETSRLLNKVPKANKLIILDRKGTLISSQTLAKKISLWQADKQSASIAIGGPEGFPQDIIDDKSDEIWSLSKMTIAHPIVKILLAEQLYRAYAILNNHPYHRGESYQN